MPDPNDTDAPSEAARKWNDLRSYHEKLRSAPGRVVWQDEATGTQVLHVPGFSRLVWYIDIGKWTAEEMAACRARYDVWRKAHPE